MYVPSDLKAVFEGKDLSAAKRVMDSFCVALSYKLIARCSCKDKTKYSFKNDMWKCSATTECFHYGKSISPTEKEVIIFSIESFDGNMIEGHKGDLIARRYREHRKLVIPFFAGADNAARETYFTKELRSVDCHVYGGRWNSAEGREVSTDFECKKLLSTKTFAQRINAPSVVKNVNIEQLIQALQSK